MGRGARRDTGTLEVQPLHAPAAPPTAVVIGGRRSRVVVAALLAGAGLVGAAVLAGGGSSDRSATTVVPPDPPATVAPTRPEGGTTPPTTLPTVFGLGPPPEQPTGTILWSANSLGLVRVDLDAGRAELIPAATGLYDGRVRLAAAGGLVTAGGSGPPRFLPFDGGPLVTLWPEAVAEVVPGPDADSVRLLVGDRVVTVSLPSGAVTGEARVPAFARVVGATGRWVILAAPGGGFRWAPEDGSVERVVDGVPTGVLGDAVHAVVCDPALSCGRVLVEPRSGARTPLPSCAEPARAVVPSPAGGWVAVVREGTGEIVVCADDGRTLSFDELDGVQPRWSADGGTLFWESSGAIKAWAVGEAATPLVFRLPANLPVNGLVAVARQ